MDLGNVTKCGEVAAQYYPPPPDTRHSDIHKRQKHKKKIKLMKNGIQAEIPSYYEEETDSSWEVQSSAGSEFLSESGEESNYEDSGDEVLGHWSTGQSAVSQPRSRRRISPPNGGGVPPGPVQSMGNDTEGNGPV